MDLLIVQLCALGGSGAEAIVGDKADTALLTLIIYWEKTVSNKQIRERKSDKFLADNENGWM